MIEKTVQNVQEIRNQESLGDAPPADPDDAGYDSEADYSWLPAEQVAAIQTRNQWCEEKELVEQSTDVFPPKKKP